MGSLQVFVRVGQSKGDLVVRIPTSRIGIVDNRNSKVTGIRTQGRARRVHSVRSKLSSPRDRPRAEVRKRSSYIRRARPTLAETKSPTVNPLLLDRIAPPRRISATHPKPVGHSKSVSRVLAIIRNPIGYLAAVTARSSIPSTAIQDPAPTTTPRHHANPLNHPSRRTAHRSTSHLLPHSPASSVRPRSH